MRTGNGRISDSGRRAGRGGQAAVGLLQDSRKGHLPDLGRLPGRPAGNNGPADLVCSSRSGCQTVRPSKWTCPAIHAHRTRVDQFDQAVAIKGFRWSPGASWLPELVCHMGSAVRRRRGHRGSFNVHVVHACVGDQFQSSGPGPSAHGAAAGEVPQAGVGRHHSWSAYALRVLPCAHLRFLGSVQSLVDREHLRRGRSERESRPRRVDATWVDATARFQPLATPALRRRLRRLAAMG